MAPVIDGTFLDVDGIPGAHGDTPVAGDALPRIDMDLVVFHPEYAIRAVFYAAAAQHALVMVDRDPEF